MPAGSSMTLQRVANPPPRVSGLQRGARDASRQRQPRATRTPPQEALSANRRARECSCRSRWRRSESIPCVVAVVCWMLPAAAGRCRLSSKRRTACPPRWSTRARPSCQSCSTRQSRPVGAQRAKACQTRCRCVSPRTSGAATRPSMPLLRLRFAHVPPWWACTQTRPLIRSSSSPPSLESPLRWCLAASFRVSSTIGGCPTATRRSQARQW
mmetsp:Transcript_7868/g.31936  ORF Transcript_7868/g.31936 Transcript_7868/m.31936 type:complete len:212 (+) Transcript_7868:539-1174(+)